VKAADFTQRHDALNNNNEVFNNFQCFPAYCFFLTFSCLVFIQETFLTESRNEEPFAIWWQIYIRQMNKVIVIVVNLALIMHSYSLTRSLMELSPS
jgi:hypothetical protein